MLTGSITPPLLRRAWLEEERRNISTVSHNTVMYAALEHAATVYGSINVVVV